MVGMYEKQKCLWHTMVPLKSSRKVVVLVAINNALCWKDIKVDASELKFEFIFVKHRNCWNIQIVWRDKVLMFSITWFWLIKAWTTSSSEPSNCFVSMIIWLNYKQRVGPAVLVSMLGLFGSLSAIVLNSSWTTSNWRMSVISLLSSVTFLLLKLSNWSLDLLTSMSCNLSKSGCIKYTALHRGL